MRLYRLFPGFVLLFASMGTLAAPEGDAGQNQAQVAAQALAEMCAKMPCRKTARIITLRASDGNTAQFNAMPYPYLDDRGEAVLYPGETITLALPKDGNGPARLQTVTDTDGSRDFGTLSPSESTLSLALNQMDGKPDMMLVVKNTAMATLKYDTVMIAPTAKGMQHSRTSTCPVPPRKEMRRIFPALSIGPMR